MSDASSATSGSSKSSFSTGTGGSVISNDNSEAGALAKLSDRDQDASIQDLLQQNKGFWDAAFSCLLLLTKNRAVKGYRMLAFRVVFEHLQMFRLVFNTRFLWVIHTDLWIWKAIYWVLFRFLVWDMGYSTYVLGMYFVCAAVLALALLTIVVAVILRKDDSSNVWLARLIWVLQTGSLLVFSVCWVAVVDYLVFMVTCHWGVSNTHLHWPAVECVKMPHLASMAFAAATAVVAIVIVGCLAMAECSGNLVSDNLMASPVAETALKTTALKVIMVCVSTCLDEFPQPQAVLMFICPCLSAYFQVRSSPYLLPWMNHLWTGLWVALVYTTGLQLVLHYFAPPEPFSLEVPGLELPFRETMTWAVLYGIFPAVLLGMAISWLVQRWKNKPIALFEAARKEAAAGRLHLESPAVLKQIYRFSSPDQVAFLARCVRRFDPVTDEVLPEAAALGNLIIQAGMARFPNDPTILLLYANYIIHVKKEPRAARQQLQVASKGEPSVIERYNIFTANDVLKRNRSDTDQGLDLMAYVEFQRNYRACVKAHKLALLSQRAFWRSLLRDTLNLKDMLDNFKAMEAAEQTAVSVYKRVLEHYPQNGKLLKVWGRFQEWVLHDPPRAARSYGEAIKRGLGDNMLNLTSDDAAADGSVPNKVDEKLDGVIIIDAGGSILMANKVAFHLFGYARGELEGKNVSILMPRPFSERHDSYLSNYLTTGVAKILNSQRSVVALRKDRSLFPLTLTVTRLSGQGQESVFMGVLRLAESDTCVRAWCTLNGMIMCCDSKLEEWLGVMPNMLTGRQISTVGRDPGALGSFVADAVGPKKADAARGELLLKTSLLHTYLQSLDVEITTGFAGTDNEPVLVLYIRARNDADRVMVVDEKLHIVYGSESLAKTLGTTPSALTRLTLPALIAPPAAQLHKHWMQEMGGVRPQAGSCRAGNVVHLISLTGLKVPVRLDIKTVENTQTDAGNDRAHLMHIVKVNRATEEEHLDSQRVSLTVDQYGVVLAASNTPKALFGFDPQAELIGQPLAAFINVFEEFRVKQQKAASSKGSAAPGSNSLNGSRVAQEQYSRLALQMAPPPDPDAGTNGLAAAAAADDSILLTLLAHAAQEGSDACYRVGVRAVPLAQGQIGVSTDQQQQREEAAGTSTLLQALGRRAGTKLQAAVMRVDVVEPDWTHDDAGSQGVRFQVDLMHTDLLRAVLELDDRLRVVKPDQAVTQMMGLMSVGEMRGKTLSKLFKLPSNITEPCHLLEASKPAHGHGKASALKQKHTSKEVRVGPVMELEAAHADGQPVKLQTQAVSKDGKASRLLLRIKLAKPAAVGTLDQLLLLCAAGSHLAVTAARDLTAAAGSAAAGPGALPAAASPRAQPGLREGSFAGRKGPAAKGSPDGRGLRFAGGDEGEEDDDGEAQQAARRKTSVSGRYGKGGRAGPDGGADDEGGWDGEHARLRGLRDEAKWEQLRSPGGHPDDYADHFTPASQGPAGVWPGVRSMRELGPSARSSLGGGEEVDGESRSDGALLALGPPDGMSGDGGAGEPRPEDAMSEMSQEEGKLDAANASDAEGDDEDLTCDWRRAKRLRRILRQLESPAARAPLARFWRGTWGAIFALLLAHIVCYAVLASILEARHTDVVGVQQLANAVDRSQMILLRANFMAKCSHPALQYLEVCSPAQRALYISKSQTNVATLQKLHEGVFLGTQAGTVTELNDPSLLEWWMLPKQTEHVFYDTDPPTNTTRDISLWNLGNRFIAAAREVNYAYSNLQLDGDAMENLRYWQYVMDNGKETLYHAYAVSLDLYVMFCWHQLGELSTLLTGLLVAELVAVALVAMAFQLDSVRRVCRQRMACFGVFLALPSATLRSMATAPCQVDEDDVGQSEDEDELELMGGAQGEESAAASGPTPAAKPKKSVQLAVDGDDEGGEAAAAVGKPKKLLAKHKGKKGPEELTGLPGWAYKKYCAVRHAAHGTFNRVMKVNGKKLHPARGAFATFLLPLLAWWIVALVIYGVSFQKVAMLQAPLTSMQAAAHVQFNIARTRMLANMLGFLFDGTASPARVELLTALDGELSSLREEYSAMLYGGKLRVTGSTPVYATSALFRDKHVADLFFNTNDCLRVDKSACWTSESKWYDVSHHGIDMMIQRFLQEIDTFSRLPPGNQTVQHSSYEYTWRVASTDLYEGLAQVSDAFVGTTITALDELQQLHSYLLIVSISTFVGVVLFVLIPYRKRLVQESTRLAGLLSQLPQESDVVGQVKQLVVEAGAGNKPAAAAPAAKKWSLASGMTAAARAAATRAAGAVGDFKARMAEASAAKAAAAAEGGGWQQWQEQPADEDDDASSAHDWE